MSEPSRNPIVLMVELAREALPVDADGICPGCGDGGFAPSTARSGDRVACRVRICGPCGLVLRHGDVPELGTPIPPRFLNSVGGKEDMNKHIVRGVKLFTGNTIAVGRPIVDETMEGLCPVCWHHVPRTIKGQFTCPCGARVQLTGRTAAQVRRDQMAQLGIGR